MPLYFYHGEHHRFDVYININMNSFLAGVRHLINMCDESQLKYRRQLLEHKQCPSYTATAQSKII